MAFSEGLWLRAFPVSGSCCCLRSQGHVQGEVQNKGHTYWRPIPSPEPYDCSDRARSQAPVSLASRALLKRSRTFRLASCRGGRSSDWDFLFEVYLVSPFPVYLNYRSLRQEVACFPPSTAFALG